MILSLWAILFFWRDSHADPVATPVVHAPTFYFEKTPPQPSKKNVRLEPVFLDARSTFDFAMGHLPQAINIRSEDYSQTEDAHRGALDPDVDLLQRKLSYLGISPKREVVVMGGGLKGHGEEGRIGWMLNYLGIKKVRVTSFDQVPGKRSVDNHFQNSSSGTWSAEPVLDLRAKRSDVEDAVVKKNAVIIDVRSANDFKKGHIPTAINIEWTQFLDKVGNPTFAAALSQVFKDHNVPLNQTLIFYSGDGVASGYATFVTHNDGFHGRHYDGSFKEWSSNPNAFVEH